MSNDGKIGLTERPRASASRPALAVLDGIQRREGEGPEGSTMNPKTKTVPTALQAIETRFLGPTNHRGSRIIAKSQAFRVVVSWDHALSVDANHAAACAALVEHGGEAWSGTWIGAGLADGRGMAWVRQPDGDS